jgi:hypothetical protein
LHDAAIVARVWLECSEGVLFARALELHQRRWTSNIRAWRTGSPIDLEDDRDWALAGGREPANANRGTMRQHAFVEDSVHRV